MSREESTKLRQLYESWTTDQLKEAFNHREDYKPEAVAIIQEELATRKVVPVTDTAVTEIRADGVYVKLKRDRFQFPAVCPKCFSPARGKLHIHSKDQTTGYYILFRRVRHLTVSVPFCEECVLLRRRISTAWLIFTLGCLALVAILSSVSEVGFASACLIVVVSVFVFGTILFLVTKQNPESYVSISSFDEASITFKILNQKWANQFADQNNLAMLTKN